MLYQLSYRPYDVKRTGRDTVVAAREPYRARGGVAAGA